MLCISYQYIMIMSLKGALYSDISAFRVLKHYLERREKISCPDCLRIMTILKDLCRRWKTFLI